MHTSPVDIEGVVVRPLTPYPDNRGSFVELFREEWGLGLPIQWNAATSIAGVVRGVHAHVVHTDYLTIASGKMLVGLQDLREGSSTPDAAAVVELDAASPVALVIPPGVAHGFYFPEAAVYVLGVSHYWDDFDELGCHYESPGVAIPWDVGSPILSEKDRAAGSLDQLRATVNERMATVR